MKSDEFALVRPDLVDSDLIEAGVDVLLNRLDVLVWIRATDDQFRDVLLGDDLCRLLEVGGRRTRLQKLAGEWSIPRLTETELDRSRRSGPAKCRAT
ncbi:hypothetical protein [Halostagnicola bangensis]